MANLSGFNAADVDPNVGFDAIPAGDYDAVITASELKETKSGTGKYLQLTLQILSGEYQNRKLWDRLNLENQNEKAVTIARGTLSAICRAVGVLTPNDSSELHDKPLRIRVKVRKDQEGNPQNEIGSYSKRGGEVAQPVGQDSGKAPW